MTGRGRVLVVDDYPDITEAVCALLGILGHECRGVLNGVDAIVVAATFAPDFVILDLDLPDLSGYDVARELRRQSRGRTMCIAALTGYSTVDLERCCAAGFDTHALKPVGIVALTSLMATRARRS